jgi:hypothetical protein
LSRDLEKALEELSEPPPREEKAKRITLIEKIMAPDH